MTLLKKILIFTLTAFTLIQAQTPLNRKHALRSVEAGSRLSIVYPMDDTKIKTGQFKNGTVLALIFWQPGNPVDTLQMRLNTQGQFNGAVPVPAQGVQAFSYVIQYHDTLKNTWRALHQGEATGVDVLISDDNETPVENAYLHMGMAWAAGMDWRKKDLDMAKAAYLRELEIHPRNYEARQTLYALLLNSEANNRQIQRKISDDIEELLQDMDSAQTLQFAIQAYQLLENRPRIAKLEADLMARFPHTLPGAELKLRQIMAMDAVESRLSALTDFVGSQPPQEVLESALGQWIGLLIQLDRFSEGLTPGDILLENAQTPGAASGLAALAGALAEEGKWLGRAESYARKAVALWKATQEKNQSGHRQWRQTLARYQDALGWVLYGQSRFEEAAPLLLLATENGSLPGYYYHYGMVLSQLGHIDDALPQLGRAASFEGGIADLAYSTLFDLFQRSGRDTLHIEALVQKEALWVENRFVEDLLAQRNIRPAPDFDLEDLNQNWVRLSDQRGTVVVLSFWSTWSKASLRVMGALHRLSAAWGDDVLFLTVATDKRIRDIETFVRSKPFKLPVLLDDAAGQKYGIEGVPMTYIIDGRGRIQFSHRGYRADLFDVIDIELDDLLQAE